MTQPPPQSPPPSAEPHGTVPDEAMGPVSQDVVVGRDRRRIAVLTTPARRLPRSRTPSPGVRAECDRRVPGLMWLPGFKSEMTSTKAQALDDWAAAEGYSLTRFDYSGHGRSAGRFETGTIGRWSEETAEVFCRATSGPQVLIGSSMGGYLALLLTRRLMAEQPVQAARIKALVLIAPAWDMTETLMWRRFPEPVRQQIARDGVWLRPSQYGEPYPITLGLIEDGRRHLLAPRPQPLSWNPGRPIVILHGRLDPDVPFSHSTDLCGTRTGGWIRLVEVPDGDHRLSRPQDIALLLQTIDDVARSLRCR